MGACASVSKSMKGEVGGALPPGPPKEETTAVVKEVKAEDKAVTVEGGEEKKAEGGDARQSLAFLLTEIQEVKESPKIEVKESPKIEKTLETKTVPPQIVRAIQEKESETLPVSNVVVEVPIEKEAIYVAPVARATKDDNDKI